jgi:hypothetical protein
MLESPEIELDRLPDGVDHTVVALLDAWFEARAEAPDGELPSRAVLNAGRLELWRDNISIYEYLPDRDDFLIRLDAPTMIEARGESFFGSTPREIDLKFGTCLMVALRKALEEKRPTFYHVNLFGLKIPDQHWLRILLPAQTTDQNRKPVYQVLGARFRYWPVDYAD